MRETVTTQICLYWGILDAANRQVDTQGLI